FFWVARMVMMGLEDTGRVPFSVVYLHGLIRDEKGEKMSKLRGNVLNPLDVIDKYGTDALRFALSTGTSPGNDIKLTPSRLEAGRNFANKLWNATRFVARNMELSDGDMEIRQQLLPLEDRWILSRLSRTISSASILMQGFQFGEAQRRLHDFIWGEFCDWYIEMAKLRLKNGASPSPLPVLLYVLEASLRLLHPYLPFVTEELWQSIKKRLPGDRQTADSIMVAAYPEADAAALDPDSERVMAAIIEIIRAIRNARAEYKDERLMPGRRTFESISVKEVQIYAGELTSVISAYSDAIQTLARARPVTFLDSRYQGQPNENTLVLELKETQVVIIIQTAVDPVAERKRLQKEIEQLQAGVARLDARLRDGAFLAKAPAVVVSKEREKLAARRDRLERLKQHLASLRAQP
ncbi:MAG: class I tRNA ligase family protein, partial [Dehalococcoidales bacterium]